MRTRVLAIVAVTAAVAFTVAGSAWAADPAFAINSDCLLCHVPGGSAPDVTDFAVGPVVRSTACTKCHWESAVSHPYHNTSWNCGSCHGEMGAIDNQAVPAVSTTNGWYKTASSATTDSGTLHVIHSNPSWAGGISKNGRQCVSCHAAASCSACHGAPAPSHGEHGWDSGSGAYSPGTEPADGEFALGTSAGNEMLRSVAGSLTCSNSTCHAAATGADAPYQVENYAAAMAYASPGTAWARSSTAGYTMNSISLCNVPGATAQLAFTGQRVEFISGKHPYYGMARIYIDGVEKATVDLYSATVEKAVSIFTSEVLTNGAHTIKVEVAATRNPASRSHYVAVDQFRVSTLVELPRTACTECHNPMAIHGAAHVASATYAAPVAFPSSTGMGTGTFLIKCLSCHRTNLLSNHGSDYTNCSMCHQATGPRSSFTTWDKTCQTGACHPGTSAPHPPNHTPHYHNLMSIGIQPDGMCQSCHGGPENQQCGAAFGCHAAAVPPATSVDFTPPSTTATRSGSDPIVWRLLPTDAGDGVAATFFSFDDGPFALYGATESAAGITNPADVSPPYAHTLRFYSVDAAGNTEAVQTRVYDVTDITPPVVTFNGIGGAPVAKSIEMYAADPKVNGLSSGVAFIHVEVMAYNPYWGSYSIQQWWPLADFSYALDGTWDSTRTVGDLQARAWAKNSGNYYTYKDYGGGSGRFQIQYYARDYAGNQSPMTYADVWIDNMGPTTSVSKVSGVWRWKLTWYDGCTAGVDRTFYGFDGGPFAEYTTADAVDGVANTQPGGEASGAHQMLYYSVDKLGNVEATKTLDYVIP